MGMSKTPPNLADLPPEVQALFAAQAAELGRKHAEMLGGVSDTCRCAKASQG